MDHRQKEGDEKKMEKVQVEQQKDKDPAEALQKREAQANRADTGIVTLCQTLLEFLTYCVRQTLSLIHI